MLEKEEKKLPELVETLFNIFKDNFSRKVTLCQHTFGEEQEEFFSFHGYPNEYEKGIRTVEIIYKNPLSYEQPTKIEYGYTDNYQSNMGNLAFPQEIIDWLIRKEKTPLDRVNALKKAIDFLKEKGIAQEDMKVFLEDHYPYFAKISILNYSLGFGSEYNTKNFNEQWIYINGYKYYSGNVQEFYNLLKKDLKKCQKEKRKA